MSFFFYEGEETYPSTLMKSTSPLRHCKSSILILSKCASNLNSETPLGSVDRDAVRFGL